MFRSCMKAARLLLLHLRLRCRDIPDRAVEKLCTWYRARDGVRVVYWCTWYLPAYVAQQGHCALHGSAMRHADEKTAVTRACEHSRVTCGMGIYMVIRSDSR